MGSQLFTSDGSWNWPSGVTSVVAEGVGAGGGGGEAQGNPSGGGGGKGGGYAKKTITKGVESSLSIIIGTSAAGTAGGTTSIVQNGSTVMLAVGGAFGNLSAANNGYATGGTGNNGTAVGDTTFSGGNGGTAAVANSGAGGGAAGPSSAGGAASSGTAGTRGTGSWGDSDTTRHSPGAAGQTVAASNGIAGGNYGGGGSGGRATTNPNKTGGAGGQGIVLLTWVDNIPPTVALNSPADTSSDSDTTPTLDFTGTDTNGDSIEYQVQIDSVNTFDSTPSEIVADSYSESNLTSATLISQGQRMGMSFIGNGGVLNKGIFYGRRGSGVTGTIRLRIYVHTGTYGSTGVPTGSPIAVSDAVDISIWPTAAPEAPLDFPFSGADKITLTNGTPYFIVFERIIGDTTAGNLLLAYDDTSPTYPGNRAGSSDGVNWTPTNTAEFAFYVYTDSVGPLINAVSETDTGFVNPDTGGDTHPFNSGENIQYTVQSALATGTYYWRVRGLDPAGSNTYGAWATTRSFTITGGGGAPVNSGFFSFM